MYNTIYTIIESTTIAPPPPLDVSPIELDSTNPLTTPPSSTSTTPTLGEFIHDFVCRMVRSSDIPIDGEEFHALV